MELRGDIRDYRDLHVWRKGIELVKVIHRLTSSFPSTETYGLTSQLRRAAVSIPSNIAEGHSRLNRGEFRQFIGVALGSSAEIDTQLVIAEELGYADKGKVTTVRELLFEVRKMLTSMLASLSMTRTR